MREPQRRREPVPRPGARPAAGWTTSRWRSGPGSCCASSRRRSRPSGSPVASLSGGQRQTVAIARSLLGDPKIIILDEPTAALGVAQTAEVLNLVERLRENGLGVIMISHNMEDVQAVADRVAVLRLGRNNGVFDARRRLHRGHHRRDHRRHRQRGHPARAARRAGGRSTAKEASRREPLSPMRASTSRTSGCRRRARPRAARVTAAASTGSAAATWACCRSSSGCWSSGPSSRS